MSQSNFTFGIMFLAFIVFITVRGELPTYLDFLRGSAKSGKADEPIGGTGSQGGSSSGGFGGLGGMGGSSTGLGDYSSYVDAFGGGSTGAGEFAAVGGAI